MAVTVNKTQKQKHIELAKAERLVADVLGQGYALYERGFAYPVTEDQMEKFLTFEIEGECPFKLHRPAKPVVVVEDDAGGSAKVKALPKTFANENKQPTAKIPEAKGQKIEISDPEGEAEIAGRAGDVEEI